MKRIVIALLLLGLPVIAVAQQQAPPPVGTFWYDNTASPPIWRAASDAFPFPVNASVSATVGGFAPSLAYATCTATGSSCTSTALPTNTGSVVLFNSGTTTVSCTLASGAATALASELQIPASSGLPLATVYDATTYDHFACIDQSGLASNVVIASGGSGLPTGWGGGGGGSGGAVTIADGADVALGTTSDAAWSSGSGTAIAILKNIAGGIAGSIPAGSALIGKVGIDQTTPGTTNGVDPATIARWGLMSGTTPGTAPTNTQVIGGIYNSSAPSPTTGQTLPLQQDSSGNLNVNVKSATGVGIGSATSGQTLSLIGCASTTAIPTATTADTWPVSCDPGNSIRVVNGASTYNTVAASQTAQALTGGSGGATGDYLSHCTIIPTSTSPGVVTILDNSTTIYSFPGGASSLSNLVPFTIPIGAQSTTGAWKVTTGVSLSVVCVGRFH